MDLMMLNGFPDDFIAGSFFIDKEKQVAVVFEKEIKIGHYHTTYIIGKDGYLKSVNIRDAPQDTVSHLCGLLLMFKT